MFVIQWQNEFTLLWNELHHDDVSVSPPLEQSTSRNSSLPAKTTDAIRSLLRLGLKPVDIQTYLQLDRSTFIAALNRINFPEEQGSHSDTKTKSHKS